ncbi:zinc-binding dehydrogenase [Stackebrandtia nassauensis]|uniref:Alcohol dehydrogenase zinc-binding domain protein n=1 Tax=Stackebrandtia nassauensis (strain DSM 44728 / CIP 108903 / NRRL B-16338 / NBRC 102104 / LLR-40K-21) TaxID=446470 RepID=D3PZK3_STANL|nr:zinc-binding dehydrogenase [Stackebrandtia nassauensis]ADD41677.1 Alcohol dehydrogenase zinc-binding domain protein [Stackebrandtia nassauensis DSM 44728]
MKAVRLYEFGPAENLRYETVPDPEPGPGQVRIRVAAAGVHLIDTVLRAGTYDGAVMKPPQLPTIPGREVAGTVEALGEGVDTSWLGAPVVTHLGMAPGGYAELAVRDVDAVHRLAPDTGFDKAVAMIGTGRTMLGVMEMAKVTDEDVVLVTGASGGIGTLIVQYARSLGATVVGAAGGPDKTARVRDNGADVAVDYTEEDWTEKVREALGDKEITVALLGGRGGSVARDSFGLLADGGRVVTYGGGLDEADQPSKEELAKRSISVDSPLGPFMMKRPGGIRSLEEKSLAALAEGRLDPATQTFPLEQAAQAHAALENHDTIGKVVLLP